jgi:hypothetical protein
MMIRSRDIIVLISFALIVNSGCSGSRNYILSGLSTSNPAVIDPLTHHTIFIESGNSSENQDVSLKDLPSRIGSKGYEILNDPAAAYYWLQTRVVYCHEATEGVTADKLARTGFGSGIGSGGTPIVNFQSILNKTGSGEAVTEADIKAIIDKILGIAEKKIPGSAPSPEGILYLCVADVQITENNINPNKNSGKPGPT